MFKKIISKIYYGSRNVKQQLHRISPNQIKLKKVLISCQKNDYFGSMQQLNILDELIDRYDPNQYVKYLQSRILVDYSFRQYCNMQTSLKNILLVIENLQDCPKELIILTYLKLFRLYLLNDISKISALLKEMKNLIPKIKQLAFLYEYKYLLILSNILLSKHDQVLQGVAEILNSKIDNQSIFLHYRQCTMVLFLTFRLLHRQETSSSEMKSNQLFTKIVQQKDIKIQLLRQCDPISLIELWLSYVNLEQPKGIYSNLCMIRAQQSIMQKQSEIGNKFLSKVPQDHPKLKFIEAAHAYDCKHYQLAYKIIEKQILSKTDSPEFDFIKYNAFKLMVIVCRKLNKIEQAQEHDSQCELFRLLNNINLQNERIQFYYLGLEEEFGLQNFKI